MCYLTTVELDMSIDMTHLKKNFKWFALNMRGKKLLLVLIGCFYSMWFWRIDAVSMGSIGQTPEHILSSAPLWILAGLVVHVRMDYSVWEDVHKFILLDKFAKYHGKHSSCALGHFSQFIMTVHPHASIVDNGADLDVVQLIQQLRKCQKAILMGRGQG